MIIKANPQVILVSSFFYVISHKMGSVRYKTKLFLAHVRFFLYLCTKNRARKE